jgi:hypothetical protein
MTALDEAAGADTNLQATLDQGIEHISNFQEVTFVQYVRLALPRDGYVFWVRHDLVSPSALINAYRLNSVAINTSPRAETTPATIFSAVGDLHYTSDARQDEATGATVNRVIFTAEREIQDLNAAGPYLMYIGRIDDIRFSFSARGRYQDNARVHHYVGDAIFADFESQIIDDPVGFDGSALIVSNSLPIWLAMNNYTPAIYEAFGNQLPLYPSFLIPDNLPPPYGAVHVIPEETRALTSAPTLGTTYSHDQLMRDRVRITLYGRNNLQAMDFLDFVEQFSLNNEAIGIMNVPSMRDEKRTQRELGVLAQRKNVEFEVSYYQSAVRDIARQALTRVIIGIYPSGDSTPSKVPVGALNFSQSRNSGNFFLLNGF